MGASDISQSGDMSQMNYIPKLLNIHPIQAYLTLLDPHQRGWHPFCLSALDA